jgi:hypothetical protein
MAEADDRVMKGPTDEVGSEGGSPGDVEIDRDTEILAGTELDQNVRHGREQVEEHDHQLERDSRPAPRP